MDEPIEFRAYSTADREPSPEIVWAMYAERWQAQREWVMRRPGRWRNRGLVGPRE